MSEKAERSASPVSDGCFPVPPALPAVNNSVVSREFAPAAPSEPTGSKISIPYTSMSAATLPLTSALSGRGGMSTAHSRRKGGPMTLYVRSGSSDNRDWAGSREEMKGEKRDYAEQTALAHGERDPVEMSSNLIREALTMGSTVTRAVKDAIPGFVKPKRRGRSVTEPLVFIFFMVVFIFLFRIAEEQIQWMIRVVTFDNEQNVIVATSLTEQLLEKANEVNELMKPVKRTPSDVLEKEKTKLKEMTELQEASIKHLHSRMLYPGPVEDVKFLVEEHVAYKTNLAKMVREELEWLEDKKQERRGRRVNPDESLVGMRQVEKEGTNSNDRKRMAGLQQQREFPKQQAYLLQKGEITMPKKATGVIGIWKEYFSSYLMNRIVAVLVLFLLTVLYLRLS
ncbi:hypothetical protein TcG_01712 [Trypanosoma cruzi]|uniref:Uncharacterized protein n=1 Tax=Trypanosoma cruzi Dm28c TaxID=1416333 RepID=V5AT52_TRYCR|nr:hypothetical protein TCDM_08021 [Trypanosoma cruzi Dm28c]KAF8284355.1 hypothetical protein TcBrA4_0057370 [Trypanosoma cruzi]PBJ72974.1 hypothetical protein BCY84_14771 [Trypanosoma cruzi cruzi]RNF23101.1 hypothetical protein TcG_01712 [Trypanosoma cruzi]